MGKLGAGSPSKRIASQAPAGEPSKHNNVLVEQYEREILSSLKPALDPNASEEVAYYGPVAEKLSRTLRRIMLLSTDQMNLIDKLELLLAFGDKLYQAREFRAADMFFYKPALQLIDSKKATSECSDEPSIPKNRQGQLYVRSLFGVASCRIQTEQIRDALIRQPGTLERLEDALKMTQRGMSVAVNLERDYAGQFAWLLLNGSIAIYSVTSPLIRLGFVREALPYLKWCLLTLNSSVMLSTTQFILWKLQVSAAIWECCDSLAVIDVDHSERHRKALQAGAAFALTLVQRLRQEEELDLPLPAATKQTLNHAHTIATTLVMWSKCAELSQLSKAIEPAFAEQVDQIRAAVAYMEQITKKSHYSQHTRGYLELYPAEYEEAMKSLLSVLMDIILPYVDQLQADEEDRKVGACKALQSIFPIPIHIAVLRYCYCIGASSVFNLKTLITCLYNRIEGVTEHISEHDTTAILNIVRIFEGIDSIRSSKISRDDSNAVEYGKSTKDEKSLRALATVLCKCVLQDDCSEFCNTNRDLLIAAAIQLWAECEPLLAAAEGTDASRLPAGETQLLLRLLESVCIVFNAVAFEDILLHSHVALRFGNMLVAIGRPRVASQIAQKIIQRIDEYRDQIAQYESFTKNTANSLICGSSAYSSALHDATFSFCFSIKKDHTKCEGGDNVGVDGTGSQFGRLHQDIGCAHTDLLLLFYRAELQEAVSIDALSPLLHENGDRGKNNTPPTRYFSEVETRLASQCFFNGYLKAMLSIQQLRLPSKTAEERVQIAEECVKVLRRMEKHEHDSHLRVARLLKTKSISVTNAKLSSTIPRAPVVVTRASSLMTVKIVEEDPSHHVVHNRTVCFYMIYGKAVGAGTAVSLNNNQLPGTASPVSPTEQMLVTISGLTPNESYVFAVAAYDERGELINGIGETSEPVIALNPLPLPLCYGYLAQVCDALMLTSHAKMSAKYLSTLVMSSECAQRCAWQANPFYRQALRREIIAKLPVPILDQCAFSLYILSFEEAGHSELDGMLISKESDGACLLSSQVAVLESARQISVGVEIAAAAGNQVLALQLCLKGYRLLLPFFHLTYGSCGLVCPVLALRAVECDTWGVDARSLFARLQFELFRVLVIQNQPEVFELMAPLLCLVNNSTSNSTDTQLPEIKGLGESLALHQLRETRASTAASASSQTSSSAPPVKNTSGTQKPSSTPQQTPRSTEDGSTREKNKILSIQEILISSGPDVEKTMKELELQAYSDKHHLELACKLASVALQMNHLEEAETFLLSLKSTGDASDKFRSVLRESGAECLLAEVAQKDVPPSDSALSPRTQVIAVETDSSEIGSECTETDYPDDVYRYQWCGEVLFLQAVIVSRRIAALNLDNASIDVACGPLTEDCVYSVMQGGEKYSTPFTSNFQTTLESHSAPFDSNQAESSTPSDPSIREKRSALFKQYITKVAASCQLYYRARCWQSLQAAAQHLWNTIIRAWTPPSEIAQSEIHVSRLASCTELILDLVEQYVVTKPSFDAVFVSSDHQFNMAPASTLIAGSTIAKLRVNSVWVSNLVTFSIRVFACAQSWERIVRMGKRYYSSCGSTREGSRFAELNFPLLVHAQNQILKRHNEELARVQAEHKAFVQAFQEQTTKRKKKKSRLVVEEVATPEELAFRARDSEIQGSIQALSQTRDHESAEFEKLKKLQSGIEKARNKCQQTLDNTHDLVSDYRRRIATDTSNLKSDKQDLTVLRRQIATAFTRSVVSCRQKRQKRLTCQALEELGDFYFSLGDVPNATKCWHETLDNAYSTLRALTAWRTIMTTDCDDKKAINGDNNAVHIEGEELWVALQSFSVLGKLQLHYGSQSGSKALECSLMAATAFTRLYSCALPHPSKSYLYGSYCVRGEFWPGRDILVGSESISLFTITLGLMHTIESLLQYEEEHAVTAMPVIAGYEYVASFYLGDRQQVVNAQRLRVTALAYSGRYREAFRLLQHILGAAQTPDFHDNKGLQDASNVAAITWLSSLELPKLAMGLEELHLYSASLVRCVLLTVLRLTVKLVVLCGHAEAQAQVWRTCAQNMAKQMLDILSPEGRAQPATTSEGESINPPETIRQQDPWETIEDCQMRCFVYLLQSSISISNGQWEAALGFCKHGQTDLATLQTVLNENHVLGSLMVGHQLKFSPCNQHATLMAKFRLQEVVCYSYRGNIHAAVTAADIGIRECQQVEEKFLSSCLQLSRAHALAQLGQQDTVIPVLEEIERSLVDINSAERSILHVRVLGTLSAMLCAQATFSGSTQLLQQSSCHLTAAKLEIDNVLRAEGWVGISKPNPSLAEISHRSKFLNLHHSALPLFIATSLDLAQTLANCPGTPIPELAFVAARVLDLVQVVLVVLGEGSHPRRMSAIKAQSLLLKGAILRKKLIAMIKVSDFQENGAKKLFEECADALKLSIQISISEGGHDRTLIRKALTELVELYMIGCFPSEKDEHVNAAFHFLGLADRVYQQEGLLFDSVELQHSSDPLNMTTLPADQQLPGYLADAIIAMNESGGQAYHTELHKVVPDASKKISNTAANAGRSQLDSALVINFFVRTWRELQMLPAGKEHLHDTALRLHYFLVHTHAKYSKLCCLGELPAVPSFSPEIAPGLVCALWSRDFTPGVSSDDNALQSEQSSISLLFTLGTTKIDMSEIAGSADRGTAFNRMERFVTMPLLSKRAGLSAAAICEARAELCQLRVDIEDESSLVIDKARFSPRLHTILQHVQSVFRKSNKLWTQPENQLTDTVCDMFGNPIPFVCTLDTVKVFENLFTVTKAVSIADNNICYYLRDLLD